MDFFVEVLLFVFVLISLLFVVGGVIIGVIGGFVGINYVY